MTKQQVSYLSDLHFDHNQWNSELNFWGDEMHYFQKQLAEIVQKWTDKEVLARSEHFQNIFRLHQEEINSLKNTIHRHEGKLAELAQTHPVKVEKKLFRDHSEIREDLNMQRKLFREMKDDFFLFLAKYL